MSYDTGSVKKSVPGTISFSGSGLMDPKLLHVVTVIYNPLLWASRIATYRAFEAAMVAAGVNLTVVECVNGDRPFQCTGTPGVTHIGVKAETLAWNKENLMNIGISRLPHDAKYIMTADADVTFRKPTWAQDVLNALQLYPVIQPWDTAYDLGPNDEHLDVHSSFAKQFLHGHPVVPNGKKFWKFDGGPHTYPHTGYAWAYRRSALDKIGGLFELGGMGSGDHHMALAMVNKVEYSHPGGTHPNYLHALQSWKDRAVKFINYEIGFMQGTIEHFWHGRKADRQYVGRWDMFLKHQFDPYTDLHKNSFGVLEFASHKPELKREFDVYLRSRNEDINSL
jgi:hypothetical protein